MLYASNSNFPVFLPSRLLELSNTACSGQMSRRMWIHLLQPGLWCRPDMDQTTHVGMTSEDCGCTCWLKLIELQGPSCVSWVKALTVFGYFYGHVCTEKNTPKICASFSAEKIKGRKIKNDFFSAKNENEIWSASKFDNGLYGKSLLWQIKQVNKSTFLVCGHCGLLLSYVTPEVWCLQGLESKELQPR